MNDLISVIVPVYNVEKYLNRCVESICSQTYDNLEIILVDDGATDHSGSMCDDFAVTDKRISVVHKQNGGLSDARNAGLAVASGAYVCFFDSDDWVEADVLGKAHKALIESDADVAIWGFSKDFVDEQECVRKCQVLRKHDCICEKEKKAYALFSDEIGLAMIGYAWNKLYRRSILMEKGLEFEKGVSLVEDMLFNAQAISAAKTIVFVDTIGTHYMQRERETLGAKFYPDFYELKLRACRARETLLKAYGATEEEVYKIMERSYFAAIKSSCRMACKTSDLTKKEKKEYIRNLCEISEIRKFIKKYNAKNKDIIIKYLIWVKCADGIMFIYSR